MESSPPDIPGYELRKILGVGGFATVYLARHVSLDRLVALKVMDPSLAQDREFCERFVREARDTARLGDHANIVTIHDFGRVGDVYYIAMQYLPGPTIHEVLAADGSSQRALQIIARVACALAHAHEQGFVHRDVKPANILFNEESEAVLSDFGIAKALGRQTQMTVVGTIVGTAHYMSPEQARGLEAIDHRSDLYSLGVVLYELLAGVAPFTASDPMAVMYSHISDPVPQLPEEVAYCQPLVERMMAKQPEDRYETAGELMEDIDRFLLDMPSCQPVEGDGSVGDPRHVGNRSGSPLWAGAAALAAILIGGYAVVDLQLLEFIRPSADETASAAGVAKVLAGSVGSSVTADGPALVTIGSRLSAPDQQRLQRLLDIAELHQLVGRISSPPGANAVEAYSLALELDPSNAIARGALARMQE